MTLLRPGLIIAWITMLLAPELRAESRVDAGVTLRTEMTDGMLVVPLALSFHQLVLEQRGRAGWKPVSVQYPQSLTREQKRRISFTPPSRVAPEDLRVQGYRAPKFPSRFLNGERLFSRPVISADGPLTTELDRLKRAPSAPGFSPVAEVSKPVVDRPTDRVLPAGDFLVQIEDGDGFAHAVDDAENPSLARLRITPANDPYWVVNERVLGPGKVVGTSLEGDVLLVAQWLPATAERRSLLRTWALDLTDPENMAEAGTVEQDLQGLDAWDLDLEGVQGLRLGARRMLWFIPARHHPRAWWSGPMGVPSIHPTGRPLIPEKREVMMFCPVAIDQGVLTAQEPQVLRVQQKAAHTSRAFLEQGLVFFSYDVIEDARGSRGAGLPSVRVPLRPLPGRVWSWLQVVDFRSGGPLLRRPVCIPGQLLNVVQADAQGAVLLTQSDLSLRKGMAPIRAVQASAYDGVNVYELDSYITPTAFTSAAAAAGPRLYLTRETGRAGVVAVGYQRDTGRISQISTWSTAAPPAMLQVTAGHLLASSPGNLELAGIAADTGKLTPVASYDTPPGLWLRVDRAMVTPTQDWWIPAGEFGVEFLQKQAPGP